MLKGRGTGFLTVLASAAIESYSNGKIIEQHEHCVYELADELERFSRQTNPFDFLRYEFMIKTIWPNKDDWRGKKEEDLYLQTNLLAKDLRHFKELSSERREELREVCLEMSNKILEELHDSYYDYHRGLAA